MEWSELDLQYITALFAHLGCWLDFCGHWGPELATLSHQKLEMPM
jgi:hypothetical protein